MTPQELMLYRFRKAPEQSKIELSDVCMYLPRTMTAYVDGSDNAYFHEYLGHGTYCEHSVEGRWIVEQERLLLHIEHEMGGEFEVGDKIRIPKGHPLIPEYVAERERLQEHMEQNYFQYEGFALFIEDYLCTAFEVDKRTLSPRDEDVLRLYAETGAEEMMERSGF